MSASAADWIMAVGTAGAAIAASIAAWKASQSTRASVALVHIERERLEDERRLRAVAELRVELESQRTLRWRIKIINGGPAAARDVSVFIHKADDDGQPFDGLQNMSPTRLRRAYVAPDEAMSVDVYSPRVPTRPPATVVLTWEDSRGEQERSIPLAEPPPDL